MNNGLCIVVRTILSCVIVQAFLIAFFVAFGIAGFEKQLTEWAGHAGQNFIAYVAIPSWVLAYYFLGRVTGLSLRDDTEIR